MQLLHFDISADEKAVRELSLGQQLLLNGVLLTARDRAHKWLLEEKRKDIAASAIYHCGPIMQKEGEQWICKAAGPTSSSRLEKYMPALIRDYGIRFIIGKGGMGPQTAQALQEYGAVYCSAVGGAAVLYANTVEEVKTVYMLEDFGMPEALWLIKVKNFPVLVTMDSRGHSMYQIVEENSKTQVQQIIRSSYELKNPGSKR